MSRPLTAACALASALMLTACSGGAVEVAPFEHSSDGECAQMAGLWPDSVGGHEARETTSDSPGVAAWGDPAIIARCGATSPGPTEDACIDVDGIDWVAVERSDGYEFTTYGRSPAIQVLVPEDYAPEPLLLPAFDKAASSIEQGTNRCR